MKYALRTILNTCQCHTLKPHRWIASNLVDLLNGNSIIASKRRPLLSPFHQATHHRQCSSQLLIRTPHKGIHSCPGHKTEEAVMDSVQERGHHLKVCPTFVPSHERDSFLQRIAQRLSSPETAWQYSPASAEKAHMYTASSWPYGDLRLKRTQVLGGTSSEN